MVDDRGIDDTIIAVQVDAMDFAHYRDLGLLALRDLVSNALRGYRKWTAVR